MILVIPIAVLVASSLTAGQASSQPPSSTDLVVMNLAAHPDDEDGRTLAYYRWARDARAYSVIYTRGEGGQNEIGPELYEELGAIRTRETERAARILGTQVYFLNYPDFGYSKSADETFDWWGGRDEVTARITYLIRKLKPDVLFTNHNMTTGHGHHQAVAISAYDAFALAADSAYHPEQLMEKGVDLWQPKRLFVRHWNRPDTFSVAVPIGEEHRPGIRFADLAATAIQEHESQGMSMFAPYFSAHETYFSLLRESDDAPVSPSDLAGNLTLDEKPPPSLRYLIDSGRLTSLPPGTLSFSDSLIVPGSRIPIHIDHSRLPSLPARIRLEGAMDTTFLVAHGMRPEVEARLSTSAMPTHPAVLYQYERFLSSPPIAYAVEDVSSGQTLAAGYLSLEIAPPILLEPDAAVVRVKGNSVQTPFRLSIWDEGIERVTVRATVASTERQHVLGQYYVDMTREEGSTLEATLDVPLAEEAQPGSYTIWLTAVPDPSLPHVAPAERFLVGRAFEVQVPAHLRVGVVESYDDALATALSELGVKHVLLDSTALAEGRFGDLHTILIDIRAYLVREDLRRYNDRLLEWVRQGGHLVVNYHKTFEWNQGEADPFLPGRMNETSFAPYPIRLGRERVTREDAPVTVLQPHHPLLHEPNAIQDEDWWGWTQERGLYFPQRYDERYVELFSMHDPDEEPLRGSTLIADYGDGTYLYTALSWYRQLKELHPGAFKFFANMISMPLVSAATDESATSSAD